VNQELEPAVAIHLNIQQALPTALNSCRSETHDTYLQEFGHWFNGRTVSLFLTDIVITVSLVATLRSSIGSIVKKYVAFSSSTDIMDRRAASRVIESCLSIQECKQQSNPTEQPIIAEDCLCNLFTNPTNPVHSTITFTIYSEHSVNS
jgi:hypothetical protein